MADPKLYTEGLIRSIVYHDQSYYQSKGDLTAISNDIDQLTRVLSVMKSRQVDERRRCRLNLALALLYETRALSGSSEGVSKRDNLAAAANFETYVEVKDRNGLAVEDETLNLIKIGMCQAFSIRCPSFICVWSAMRMPSKQLSELLLLKTQELR
ncbi:MAG: hypothetical protein HC888_14980 [Candidatus Competibacteraceae bacterium]|nr:hypothetical protein [Candidatus Competibacteraceae bacterium]